MDWEEHFNSKEMRSSDKNTYQANGRARETNKEKRTSPCCQFLWRQGACQGLIWRVEQHSYAESSHQGEKRLHYYSGILIKEPQEC